MIYMPSGILFSYLKYLLFVVYFNFNESENMMLNSLKEFFGVMRNWRIDELG